MIITIFIVTGVYFNPIITNVKERTDDFINHVVQHNEQKMLVHVEYIKKEDYLLFGAKRGWESRVTNTTEMFIKAFNLIRDEVDTDFSLDIDLGDYSEISLNLAYAYRNTNEKYLIPDFSFEGWPEIGIINYDDTCKEIEKAGKEPYIYNKVFWIGSILTNPIREELVKIGKNNENFEFIPMTWERSEKKQDYLKKQQSDKYVSLPDHTQYKYLIDVPGIGYSARIKLLMFANRPLFIVDRKENEFYMKDLKPFVHYIPVKGDLSDLEEKYQWAEEHYDEAQQIARNALDYAKTHLTTRAAIYKFSEVILQYIDDYKILQKKIKKAEKYSKVLSNKTKK